MSLCKGKGFKELNKLYERRIQKNHLQSKWFLNLTR